MNRVYMQSVQALYFIWENQFKNKTHRFQCFSADDVSIKRVYVDNRYRQTGPVHVHVDRSLNPPCVFQVEARDKEIGRLTKQLEGGRPVDAVLRDSKRDSGDRVLAHLNVQVLYCIGNCSSQCSRGCTVQTSVVCVCSVKFCTYV